MKTVTLKADSEFDALLARLASRLGATRSRVIRDAVRKYEEHLDREELRRKVHSASLKTRQQALEASGDFRAADSDGV